MAFYLKKQGQLQGYFINQLVLMISLQHDYGLMIKSEMGKVHNLLSYKQTPGINGTEHHR